MKGSDKMRAYNEIFHKYNFDGIKWNEMFDNEAELISKLKSIDVTRFISKGCKGGEFIQGFQRTLNAGRELSKPQITQLKLLAKEVYRYHNTV
jgi:hypothetical protein